MVTELLARCREADGIVFDFGGVITVSGFKRWETGLYPFVAQFGLTREHILDGFEKYRRMWDASLWTFDEMYRRIFADAGAAEPGADVLAKLWDLDAGSWIARKRPETLELMRAIKAEGKKLAILSNMSADYFDRLYAEGCREYRALADVEVISGHVNICKPDPAIYEICRERMGMEAGRLLFFDDTQKNVDAARALGWQAERYV